MPDSRDGQSVSPRHGDVWERNHVGQRFSVLMVCGHHDPPHVTGCWHDEDGLNSCLHDAIPLPRFLASFSLVEREFADARPACEPKRGSSLMAKKPVPDSREGRSGGSPEELLRALEELRRVTGVDEWDEADWRALAYCEAWEALGEDRAYEVIGGVHADRFLHADDVLFTVEHAAGHIRTTSKEQACKDMAEHVAKSFGVER